jgi:hypothetical protein
MDRLLPPGVTPELIEDTRKTFQPYYKEPLADDDCIEMLTNVFQLYDILYADDLKPPTADDGQSGK